jgi:hypothetical protein
MKRDFIVKHGVSRQDHQMLCDKRIPTNGRQTRREQLASK